MIHYIFLNTLGTINLELTTFSTVQDFRIDACLFITTSGVRKVGY